MRSDCSMRQLPRISFLPGQADLAAALLAPERAAPAGLAPQARLAVYRNNVVVSLTDALAAAYPAVLSLVGERFFKAAAGVYVRAEPPRSPVLITYGQSFAQFLEGFAPAAKLPFLADVARLERLWLEAYHAADAAPQPIEGARARSPRPTCRRRGSRCTPRHGCSAHVGRSRASGPRIQAAARTRTSTCSARRRCW